MTQPARAWFRGNGFKPICVHFNPASLQLSISNTISKRGGGSKKPQAKTQSPPAGQQQTPAPTTAGTTTAAAASPTKAAKPTQSNKPQQRYVSESKVQLSVELVFDTTDHQRNVCDETREVWELMGEKGNVPAVVSLDWGSFEFTGIIESYKETIELFSSQGVPLRSTVSITMSKEDKPLPPGKKQPKTARPSAPSPPVKLGAPPESRRAAARGAFASLRTPPRAATPERQVDPDIEGEDTHGYATGDGAAYELGGRSISRQSGGLGGGAPTSPSRMRFEDEKP